jgi:hypothetical protein
MLGENVHCREYIREINASGKEDSIGRRKS